MLTSLDICHIGSKFGIYGDAPHDFYREIIEKHSSKKTNIREKLKEAVKNLESAVGDLPSDSLLISEASDLINEAMEMMM